MSFIPLSEAKTHLQVIHDYDDTRILTLLEASETDALEFMNRKAFGEICEEDSNYDEVAAALPNSVKVGVFLLLESLYQAKPDDQALYRKIAQQMLMPFRCRMGI